MAQRYTVIEVIVRYSIKGIFIAAGILLLAAAGYAESQYTDAQIADAIYLAEGGPKALYAYGVLKHYRHTSARQACLNTIAHARRDYKDSGDFILFLSKRYAPIGAANDPRGLNKNWIKNVKFFLQKAEQSKESVK